MSENVLLYWMSILTLAQPVSPLKLTLTNSKVKETERSNEFWHLTEPTFYHSWKVDQCIHSFSACRWNSNTMDTLLSMHSLKSNNNNNMLFTDKETNQMLLHPRGLEGKRVWVFWYTDIVRDIMSETFTIKNQLCQLCCRYCISPPF